VLPLSVFRALLISAMRIAGHSENIGFFAFRTRPGQALGTATMRIQRLPQVTRLDAKM
jgi:hypothetical protein